ncbi:MAG: AAA family ATPase [Candidatus Pacebacteria bacterium]|jgi:DNA polymerase III delta prime subunit|nr:AAA family ATPase [Candidatus Paceibacterota bacterium]
MNKDFLWVEKYRPKKIDECILSDSLKDTFREFLSNGDMPNLLLSGSAGTGKTTVAKALCEELGYTTLVINGSLDRNIDTLRNDISTFASTVSFDGGKKCVILDEADYLNPQSFQPALRGFIEHFSKNVRFILTCNFKDKIIEPIHSRTTYIDFRIGNRELPGLMGDFMNRTINILGEEGVTIESKPALAELIKRHFPDMRRTLNELQRYCAGGTVDTGILARVGQADLDSLMTMLKDKDFSGMRQWVVDNIDTDPIAIYRQMYDQMHQYLQPQSIPQVVLLIADYQYKQAFVQDAEINLVAFLTEVMVEVEWK